MCIFIICNTMMRSHVEPMPSSKSRPSPPATSIDMIIPSHSWMSKESAGRTSDSGSYAGLQSNLHMRRAQNNGRTSIRRCLYRHWFRANATMMLFQSSSSIRCQPRIRLIIFFWSLSNFRSWTLNIDNTTIPKTLLDQYMCRNIWIVVGEIHCDPGTCFYVCEILPNVIASDF